MCVQTGLQLTNPMVRGWGGRSSKKKKEKKCSCPNSTGLWLLKVRQHSLVKWGHYFLCDSRAISVGLCTPRCNWWQRARAPGPQGRNSCVSLSEVPPQTAGDGQASKDAAYFSLEKMLVCRRACSPAWQMGDNLRPRPLTSLLGYLAATPLSGRPRRENTLFWELGKVCVKSPFFLCPKHALLTPPVSMKANMAGVPFTLHELNS